MTIRTLLAAALLAGGTLTAAAQGAPQKEGSPPEKPAEPQADRPIRNAPSPHAIELAAYIFSASNVCGYKIGGPEFTALLAKLNAKPEDVGPRGAFGNRMQGIFTMMSNDMNKHREQSCIAVAGEYGPEGTIAKNVLQPAAAETPPTEKGPERPAQ